MYKLIAFKYYLYEILNNVLDKLQLILDEGLITQREYKILHVYTLNQRIVLCNLHMHTHKVN